MLLPPILAYMIIPFGAGIREKIYYKSYEMGNNGFYIPSISAADILEQAQEEGSEDEEVNIEN
ncbi:MAG: hypothetical protein WCJ45_09560 [bacterium]